MTDDKSYPIIINGEPAGSISARRDGLYTVIEGECADGGGLLRLSLYGENREVPLGVMMPKNGKLTLSRRFSRTALKAFPEQINFAGPSGMAMPAAEPAVPAPAMEEKNGDAENICSAEEGEHDGEEESHNTGAAQRAPPPAHTVWLPEPNPWSLVSSVPHKYLLRHVHGALTAREDGVLKLAVPVKSIASLAFDGLHTPLTRRRVRDTDYILFEIKNGKLF